MRLGALLRALVSILVCTFAVACTGSQRAGIWASLRGGENKPVAPFEMAPGLYYVGARNVAVYALTSSDGIVIIDGGYPSMAPQVLANLQTLGLDPRDVRVLLNTHAHFDHSGGLAALKQATGAQMLASQADAELLESGGRGDFYLGNWMTFPRVIVDREFRDGEVIRVGDLEITAHITPGHTKGCTSWSFPVHIEGATYQALLVCSVSRLQYDLVDNPHYPGIADDFLRTFATLRALPCDIPLGSHGDNYALDDKRTRLEAGETPNPFIDAQGCATFLADAEAEFREALEKQQR